MDNTHETPVVLAKSCVTTASELTERHIACQSQSHELPQGSDVVCSAPITSKARQYPQALTMGDFLESLWGSVFAPGPTPTLLIATNVTFATLQAVLLALLIGTYSIHFAILSVLCCGLWCSINWFANELRQAQGIEEEAERLRKQSAVLKERRGGVADSEADDEGEGTETEAGQGMGDSMASMASTDDGMQSAMQDAPSRTHESQAEGGAAQTVAREVTATGAAPRGATARDGANTARQRMTEAQDRSGDVSSSTDSEWEKVDADR
ncbi:SMK killer toxin resistance protein [Friedmanniomyces endolithicus]|nr:SMK killer toxin resistance protein [Friedmanniomyces endolithicus]KAK1817656.1 SMK killer toxin resistance protein [Friedmanniomyces endolithicus]